MNYTDFRDRLRDEINKKLASLDYSECTLDAYDKSNWKYRQAHKNGYRSCCRQFLKLIDIIDHEEQNDRKSDRPPTVPTGGAGTRPEQEIL